MKKLAAVVLGVVFLIGVFGMVTAGELDSPGAPEEGSGMYSLQNLYDYLNSGTALTVETGFQEPSQGPTAGTMKTTKEIGDSIKAKFDQCDAAAGDVADGKKFFSTQSGTWGVQTGTAPGGGLLATGQTIEYRSGDDGTYQAGLPLDYTDNGDNTVTDNNTGLMWIKDHIAMGTIAGVDWDDTMTWNDAIDNCEALDYATHDDWRLPNIKELVSIVDYGTFDHAIDPIFSLTMDYYWSSTTCAPDTGAAWQLDFRYGYVADGNKSGCRWVRAVRGGGV